MVRRGSVPLALTIQVCLVGLAAMPACAGPEPAVQLAQYYGGQPRIESFSAAQVEDLSPGTELLFTVVGSPRATVALNIGGTTDLPMREVVPGQYEVAYTIRRQDRITSNTPIQATLRLGNRQVNRRLLQPLVLSAAATQEGARINRFRIKRPVDRLEPGTELAFRLNGTPGGRASFTIAGITRDRPMEEVEPGIYEGTYTIRRNDNFPAGIRIVGRLNVGGQTAIARLDEALVADRQQPSIENPTPADNATISNLRPLISAAFNDPEAGVDPRSVRVRLNGRDVTAEATTTADYFNYRPERNLSPGTYRVEVDLKDRSGNSASNAWSFSVLQPGSTGFTGGTGPLAITILSPEPNSTVPAGPITVRGQTAPYTSVTIDVQATASLIGLLGLTQNVFNRTTQADAQGNFSFRFESPLRSTGTRYEVNLTANKDGQTTQQRLILTQQ